ncbi:ArnT family glycosyltransferase [Sphingorhabdus wooponensis]|nr:glycosyltransferase family 39 protein [Sphingorhabdus wooponensis]
MPRVDCLLAIILLAALVIRLYSVAFGLPALTDPDELMFELGAYRMIDGGQLNPEWFGHPATTTMYMLALIDVAVLGLGLATGRFTSVENFAAAIYADPSILVLPHRIAIVLIAVVGIALAYRLATLLFGRPTGLVTAAVLAVSPVHITYSQLVRSDMMATVFMLLAMLCALAYARHGSIRALVVTGFCIALAITTKWPFVVIFLSLAGAVVLRWRNGLESGRRTLVLITAAAAGTMAAMVLISPFLIIEWNTVIANLRGEVQPHHLGATGGSLIDNAFWYMREPFVRAFGITGLTLAAIGAVFAVRSREFVAVALVTGIAMLVLASSQYIVWERWILATVPLLAMLVALALMRVAAMAGTRLKFHAAPLAAGALMAATLVPLLFAALADGRERMNDTRLMASAWLRANAAPGSTVFVEHFAFDLVESEFDFVFPLGIMGCQDVRGLLDGRIDNSLIASARGGRSNIDYGTVVPEKIDTCRADYAVLSQYARYAVEKERFPGAWSQYSDLIARGEKVAEFRPERGVAGGWPVMILRFPDNE